MSSVACGHRIALNITAASLYGRRSMNQRANLFAWLLVLAKYSDVAMRGSADSQTKIWTITITEDMFMAWAIFIVNSRDGASTIYYTGNLQLCHVSVGLPFRLSVGLLNVSAYSVLYKFARRIEGNPVLAALAMEKMYRIGLGDNNDRSRFC